MSETMPGSVAVSEAVTPPQALDAERSVLAAMLLDPEAIGRAIELIEPRTFYRAGHQKIYEAILALYDRNEKADLVTLSEELRKRGDLEAVGGPPALAQVLEYATTTANLDHHIRIIHAKDVLRQLIKASAEIQQESYAGSDETAAILDRAEQRIFAIADQRVRAGFVSVRDLLKPSFEHIQKMFERQALVTGVPTGYTDLDEITAGFQNSDLIIVAGRPSMGKSALALNFAENAAIPTGKFSRVPVAVFSLEMSKEQLAQRLLCSQGGISLHRVRSGRLTNEDWPRLTTAAGLLNDAPILIDDSPSPSLMEIRAKCRRLRAENKLGLLIVDYLQLIRGSGRAENRVQEISQITRGLKSLAKELNVPIIALSQLSRAVETRDKTGRPQLSDLRESGCLTADTRVARADDGGLVSLGELLERGERDIPVWTLDHDLRIVRGTMIHVFASGVKPVFELRLASGRTVKASGNHPFLTLDGWRPLERLEAGTRLAVPRLLPEPERTIPRGRSGGAGVAVGTAREFAPAAVAADVTSAGPAAGILWDTIASITPLGDQPVFDATVPGTHNFIADGILAHNSIEQDSDLVLFVFREIMYNKDAEEPNKAELIIAKQRNGPTGTVKLTFLRESTKFVPYSPTFAGETQPEF
jgi:replicative DNA helicase